MPLDKFKSSILLTAIIILAAVIMVQGFFLLKLYRHTEVGGGETDAADIRLLAKAAQTGPVPSPSAKPSPSVWPTLPDPLNSGLGWDPGDFWVDTPWDPFTEFQHMQERMNRLFDDSFSRFRQAPDFMDREPSWSFAPRLDVREEDDRYVVRLDVPGAEKSDLSVKLEDRLLTVSGEINETVEREDGNSMLRKERRSGKFQRALTMPGPVQADAMTADYNDGVLTVTVPKGNETGTARTLTI